MKFLNTAWRISPSDLTFTYRECRRCLWMQGVGGLPRPRGAFPKVFSMMDAQIKAFFRQRRTEDIAPGIRAGHVLYEERWVRSVPIPIAGHELPVILAGRFDTVFGLNDGGFAVADYKTAVPRPEHVEVYAPQLHSYAIALERPAPGSLAVGPVTQLGLICVEPEEMVAVRKRVAYAARIHWIEVERDDRAFFSLLSDVLDVLEAPDPPEAAPDCQFCRFVGEGALALLTGLYRPSDAER